MKITYLRILGAVQTAEDALLHAAMSNYDWFVGNLLDGYLLDLLLLCRLKSGAELWWSSGRRRLAKQLREKGRAYIVSEVKASVHLVKHLLEPGSPIALFCEIRFLLGDDRMDRLPTSEQARAYGIELQENNIVSTPGHVESELVIDKSYKNVYQ
jgi:hypothetical protein